MWGQLLDPCHLQQPLVSIIIMLVLDLYIDLLSISSIRSHELLHLLGVLVLNCLDICLMFNTQAISDFSPPLLKSVHGIFDAQMSTVGCLRESHLECRRSITSNQWLLTTLSRGYCIQFGCRPPVRTAMRSRSMPGRCTYTQSSGFAPQGCHTVSRPSSSPRGILFHLFSGHQEGWRVSVFSYPSSFSVGSHGKTYSGTHRQQGNRFLIFYIDHGVHIRWLANCLSGLRPTCFPSRQFIYRSGRGCSFTWQGVTRRLDSTPRSGADDFEDLWDCSGRCVHR